MVYFALLLLATCFSSIYSSHFRLKYYLLKKVIHAIGNIVVDCEISHYILKML